MRIRWVSLLVVSVFQCIRLIVTDATKEQGCSSIVISEAEVFNLIMKNYSKEMRPRRDARETVEVTVSMHLERIIDFVEVDSTLILSGYIHMVWMDDYLAWNSTHPYSCVRFLTVPPNSIWTPDLEIINNARDVGQFIHSAAETLDATLSNNGRIAFDPSGTIAVTCEIDLRMFPFDHQICHVRIESSNYYETQETFQLDPCPLSKITDLYIEHRRWEIVDNYSQVVKIGYYDYDESYSNVIFTLVLRRKYLFYYVSIIIPSITIAVVELVTFAMPVTEVSKFNFSVMCLLAYSIFQAAIASDMPRISDTVPLLSLFINLQMLYIALIPLLAEGLVYLIAGFANTRQHSPPLRLFELALTVGGFLLVNKSKLFDEFNRTMPYSRSRSNATDQAKEMRKRIERQISARWMYVAEVMERINLIIYISAVFLTPVTMFIAIRS